MGHSDNCDHQILNALSDYLHWTQQGQRRTLPFFCETPHNHYQQNTQQNWIALSSLAQKPQPDHTATKSSPPSAKLFDSDLVQMAQSCQNITELHECLHNNPLSILQKTARNTVFADGNPQADLLIIGEAPGFEEDKKGLPFVGRSGKLLDNMLSCIGLSRHAEEPEKSVLISNMLFWRPPENRKPTAEEAMICLPFLKRLIDLTRPKLLLLAGGTALTHLCQISIGIMKMRGKWQKITIHHQQYDALPTFHPAYLLRNPIAKKQAWLDLLSIKSYLS